ncbi:hypothetical protein JCM11491_002067 [Sporobolomyces phaffii]
MSHAMTPTTPTKRPLTEFLAASKRVTDEITAKKRKLSESPQRLGPSDGKENWQLGSAERESSAAEQAFAHATLPSPHATSEVLPLSADASVPRCSTIPHVFAHAHLLLSTSSPLTAALPFSGRTDQRDTLIAFLSRRFPNVYPESKTSTTSRGPGPAALYASGPPGIGKTALLSSVLGDFVSKVEAKGSAGDQVRVCMRNCSTVGTGETAWEGLGTGLGMDWNKVGRGVKLKGKEAFEQGLKDGKKYLLILDEIDHLCTRAHTTPSSSSAPDLLNALFSLASIPASPLTLIGIANDLTLKALNLSSVPSPMKLFGKAKAKPDPLTTPTKPISLHFAPYSWQELAQIVSQRLELLSPAYPIPTQDALAPTLAPSSDSVASSKLFPLIDKVAIERAAKKVATGTGDVRTVLDLVRKCISLSVATLDASSLSDYSPSNAPKASMKHMTAALSSSTGLTTAPSLSARLQTLNPNHRFVLVALLIALSRSPLLPYGLETTDSNVTQRSSVTLEEGWIVYRQVVGNEESLKNVMHSSKDGFGQAIEMIQDLGGLLVVANGGAGGGTPSPSKRRKTPSPSKKGRSTTKMVISMSETAPMHELANLFAPGGGVCAPEREDESTRLCRKMVRKELSDQQWKRKLVAMGRDEQKRAEEELEGREWERAMKAQAHERGELV